MSGNIKIKLTNGSEQIYEFEPQAQPNLVGTKLKEMLNSSALVLHLDNELEIIPFANIQSITVLPAQEIPPGTKIQGTLAVKRIP